MSCNCGKNIKSSDHIVLKMAQRESNLENEKYIIYEIENKTTYDRFECWKKQPKGEAKMLIYPL